jgi:hypothetical protein
MQILSEIIETSDRMIKVLNQSKFFEDHPLMDSTELKLALQTRMQKKWEQENEMILTDIEFMEVCNEEIGRIINESLESLLQKGAINMSVGEDGEILYSANPDFDINKLKED